MSLVLDRRVDLVRGSRVLHVAPEHAIARRLVDDPTVDYTSVDLQNPSAAVHADLAGGLPYRSGTFDLIICSHVLEHIVDDRAAMDELRRVLRDGGLAMILVPVADRPTTYEDPSVVGPEERLEHFGQADHVRIYGHDLYDRLEETGFILEPVDPEDVATTEEIDRYRLTASEKLILCR